MLAKIIKDYRKTNNLTQNQLAEMLNVSRSAVAKWEQEKGIPNKASLEDLSKILNISISELMTEDEPVQIIEKIEKKYKLKTIVLKIILFFILGIYAAFIIIMANNDKKDIGDIIYKSVSPDGNITLTVYDNTIIGFKHIDDNTDDSGYKIILGDSTWVKQNCEFIGLHWSADSRFVVEEYLYKGTKRWMEITDFKRGACTNLQVVIIDKICRYYQYDASDVACELEFVTWVDDTDLMQIKFELEKDDMYIKGYVFANVYAFEDAYDIVEIK